MISPITFDYWHEGQTLTLTAEYEEGAWLVQRLAGYGALFFPREAIEGGFGLTVLHAMDEAAHACAEARQAIEEYNAASDSEKS